MAITPLTPDQRDMVADNHNLIYGVLNKHNRCIEDWYGCAAVGLCRAAQSYDPGRGFTFSSYAYAVMLNEIRHHLRAARLGKRTAVVVSLDDPEDPLSIYRVPAAQGNTEEEGIANVRFCEWWGGLNRTEKRMVRLLASGMRQSAISNITGMSKPAVSRWVTRARNQLFK